MPFTALPINKLDRLIMPWCLQVVNLPNQSPQTVKYTRAFKPQKGTMTLPRHDHDQLDNYILGE